MNYTVNQSKAFDDIGNIRIGEKKSVYFTLVTD